MTLLHDQSGRLFTHQKCSLKDILVNKEVGDRCLGSWGVDPKLELLKKYCLHAPNYVGVLNFHPFLGMVGVLNK